MAEDGSLNAAKSKWKMPLSVFFQDPRQVFNLDGLGREILGIAFPAALALAADPIASLIDTAFIGHMGPVELAAAGVSIALFNQASRITIFPLVSITTSFVAEEDTIVNLKAAETNAKEVAVSEDDMLQEVKQGSSSVDSSDNTTSEGSGNSTSENSEIKEPVLSAEDEKADNEAAVKNENYLRLRTLGAPAALQALAMQGIFRDFRDTKTPLYVNICGYGIKRGIGSNPNILLQIGHQRRCPCTCSIPMMAVVLFLILMKKMDLLPPSAKDLQIFRFLKNGGLLLARVVALPFIVTLSALLAARHGAIPMAAFQPCLQVLVSVVSVGTVFILYKTEGFIGIWIALTIYMALRKLTGIWRKGTGTAHWKFLRGLS